MRAASFGIPFQPIPVGALEATDIPAGLGLRKVADPYTGLEVYAVPKIELDWFVMHAPYVDAAGNVRVLGNPVYDEVASRAAKHIIVTAEEIVPSEDFERQAELTLIPHFMVDAVVHVPGGARPGSCYPLYEVDEEGMRHYIELSRTPEGLRRYLEETAPADRAVESGHTAR